MQVCCIVSHSDILLHQLATASQLHAHGKIMNADIFSNMVTLG
jgi:hypothetical protein